MKKLSKLFLMFSLMSAICLGTLIETVLADATKGQISVNGRIGEASDEENVKDPDEDTKDPEEEIKDPEEDGKKPDVTDDDDHESRELPKTGSENRESFRLIGSAILILFVIVFMRNTMKLKADKSNKG